MKLVLNILLLGLVCCSNRKDSNDNTYLSKEEARRIAVKIQRTKGYNNAIESKDSRLDFFNGKWVFSSNKPSIALNGGLNIILDARTGVELYPVDKNKIILKAQTALRKAYPQIDFKKNKWSFKLYRGKWIYSPNITNLGGGATVEIDSISGEIMKVYFSE